MIFQIYTRVDVFCEDGSVENLLTDATQRRVADLEGNALIMLRQYARQYIVPEERGRFLAFYDLETAAERAKRAHSDHVTAFFHVPCETEDAPVLQMFTLIPFQLESRRYLLSCVRRVDNFDRERSAAVE